MSSLFDYANLLFVTAVTIIIIVISFKIVKVTDKKIALGLLDVSLFIYSGVGTAFKGIESKFILYYILFLICVNFGFIVITCRKKQSTRKYSKLDDYYKTSPSFFRWCAVLLFFMTFINLIFPEVRLKQLFRFDLFNIIGIFERRAALRQNNISYVVNIIKLNLLPFFFVYLYDLKNRGKRNKAIFLYLLWIYMDFTVIGYISRYQIIIYMLLAALIYFENNGNISKSIWIGFGFVILLSVPLLLAYEQIRMGIIRPINFSFSEAFKELLQKECNYPTYYSSIISWNLKGLAPKYFSWLFTLPIPKKLIPIDQLLINDMFTYFVTGKIRMQSGFSVVLPSVLGEGIMIYGGFLFWIHGIVIGVIIGILFNYFEKSKCLRFWNYYFFVNLLTIGRGGSQGVFGNIINSIFLLTIIIIIMNSLKRDKFLKYSDNEDSQKPNRMLLNKE